MPALWFQLRDGYTFSLDEQRSVDVEGTCVAFTSLTGVKYLWRAVDATDAAGIVAAIDAANTPPPPVVAGLVPIP